jgi:hypothetical protein
MKPYKMYGLIRFEDWSMSDPDDNILSEALWKAIHNKVALSEIDMNRICRAASDFVHLAGHPATNKSIITQLRKLRKAVKHFRSEAEKEIKRRHGFSI